MNVVLKPHIIRTMNRQFGFLIVMWLMTLISIGGVFYVWGIYVAMAALIARVIFKAIVFRIYYNRELNSLIAQILPTGFSFDGTRGSTANIR